MLLEKVEKKRYKIVSQTFSYVSKRFSVGILDHYNQEIFNAPVRIILADEEFCRQLCDADIQLANSLNEREKLQFEC